MKKLAKVAFACMALFSAVLTFAGCSGAAPWDYSNVTWHSESPVIEFNTEMSGEPSLGYIEIDGESLEVYLWWGPPTYTFKICVYDSETNFAVGTDQLLLNGKVKYDHDSTYATLVIQTDNIFDNQYQTIKLIRVEK